jgi:hypothetical protein
LRERLKSALPDEPIHDPVYARSLILEVSGERLAFVAVDLGVFTSENIEKDQVRPNGYMGLPSGRTAPHVAFQNRRSRTVFGSGAAGEKR